MKEKKRKVGRPKLAKAEVKNVIAIRVTDDEREEYRKRADRLGIPLSEWIRETLKQAR